jgi:hypothetical protein
MIRLDVDRIPSFAPKTAARNQPSRDVAWSSSAMEVLLLSVCIRIILFYQHFLGNSVFYSKIMKTRSQCIACGQKHNQPAIPAAKPCNQLTVGTENLANGGLIWQDRELMDCPLPQQVLK